MSNTQVRLIPLACVKCQAAILAGVDEVAWVCESCGQGLILNEEKGLLAQDIYFSKAIAPGQKGRPFWVARGTVTITTRETYKGNELRAANEFWAAPRLFYVPAWDASLDEVIQMGSLLLRTPERMEPGSPAPFLPVVTSPGDLAALAEFMVVSLEADRRDALKKLDFTVQLEPAQLWVLR